MTRTKYHHVENNIGSMKRRSEVTKRTHARRISRASGNQDHTGVIMACIAIMTVRHNGILHVVPNTIKLFLSILADTGSSAQRTNVLNAGLGGV